MCSKFIDLPTLLFSWRSTCAVMIALSACFDSLIAFKSAFLTCMGIYTMAVLNMFYKDSRPFWESIKITSYGHCYFDFASPDTNMFILTFFYSYNFIMYRFKYNSDTSCCSRVFSWFLLFILFVAFAATYFCGVALGLNYLY